MRKKTLLAAWIIPLACLHFASADDTAAAPISIATQCTQQGVGKGYTGKALEDFVAACVKAGQSSGEDDPVIRAAMSSC